MFSADSVEALFRTALDLAALECKQHRLQCTMQKQEGTLGVSVENELGFLEASQNSALAHSVSMLTISAVTSSFLPDAQLLTQCHDLAETETGLSTKGGVTDVFPDGACFPALSNLQQHGLNRESYLHEGNSSFDHIVLCDVPNFIRPASFQFKSNGTEIEQTRKCEGGRLQLYHKE